MTFTAILTNGVRKVSIEVTADNREAAYRAAERFARLALVGAWLVRIAIGTTR